MSWSPHRVTQPERLEDDRPVHLGVAGHAVGERDRDLDHAQTRSHDAVRHLHLEHVAARLHAVEPDRTQRIGAVDPISGRGVVDRQSEHDRHVAVAPAGQPRPATGPSRDRAPGDVTRADHERDAAGGDVEHGRQHLGIVGVVGVDLDDRVVALGEGHPERVEVGVAQPPLGVALDQPQPAVLFGGRGLDGGARRADGCRRWMHRR